MSALRSQLERAREAVLVDLTQCAFIRHTGVAFLGALIRLGQHKGKQVTIDWSTARSHIGMNLRHNGFARHFGEPVRPFLSNTVPYREDFVSPGTNTNQKRDEVMGFLRDWWLGRGRIQLSIELGNRIRGRVWEIYANAFEHAGSPIGVMTCGFFYPKERHLGLGVVDFGSGIPEKVRAFLGRPRMRASDALRWAFQRGNSTDPGIGRGLGFDILREFVRVNCGRMDVYSDGAHARVNKDGERFEEASTRIGGTIVDIRFNCDETLYMLASEVPKGPLF
jgi:hypothetical protein